MTDTITLPSSVWNAEEYYHLSHGQLEAATQLLSHLSLKGYEQILDVGCGDGKITARIASAVPAGYVKGIDISSEMIDFAKIMFPKDDFPNLNFNVLDAKKVNFINEFDIVFSSFALQWISDKNAFFKKVFECLKTEGTFIGTVPLQVSAELEKSIALIVSDSEWSPYFKHFRPNWHFTRSGELKQVITENGFSLKRFTTCLQNMVFSTRESFEKYIQLWFPYLKPLPDHLKQQFFSKVMDEYFKLLPITHNGEAHLNFHRVDIIADKNAF